MLKLVDKHGLEPCALKSVEVRVLLAAPKEQTPVSIEPSSLEFVRISRLLKLDPFFTFILAWKRLESPPRQN